MKEKNSHHPARLEPTTSLTPDFNHVDHFAHDQTHRKQLSYTSLEKYFIPELLYLDTRYKKYRASMRSHDTTVQLAKTVQQLQPLQRPRERAEYS